MKVSAFVDGFNLYHSIVQVYAHQRFKWLDLKKLATRFIAADDDLRHVVYYTAYPTWEQAKQERQKEYVRALSATGVKASSRFGLRPTIQPCGTASRVLTGRSPQETTGSHSYRKRNRLG